MLDNKNLFLVEFLIIKAQSKVSWASLVTQMLKHLPAMYDTWLQSLGQEDPLEKGKATLSNILAWKIPWTENPGMSTGSHSQTNLSN